jgi:Carboxypeptidase regulatory-like domain
MRKYFILPLLLVLALELAAPRAFAQITGTVKGTCTDADGKPIVGAQVEWTGLETGRKYTLKTNNKGEYFSLGITPGKYNVKLSKDGKEIFQLNGVPVGLDEKAPPVDFDMKKEQVKAAQSQGKTPEQIKADEEAAAKAANETKKIGTLNDKLKAARVAEEAKDYETAITTLNEANQIDPSHDQIWFELANA